ncbi:hypothetical protein C7293_00760 [filamentous cyanobacterium CCT1]|nr:hypothetical protein C7293_00760 [filamentous cyanobacterium CCT1]PSN80972.1 hypothetical protein C8B47_03905 [filamentous cyanobacterium CCP4]
MLDHNDDETFNRVAIVYRTPSGEQQTLQADVVADTARTVLLQGSCASDKASAIAPYRVENLVQRQDKVVGAK